MPGYQPVPFTAELMICECGALTVRWAETRHDRYHDEHTSPEAHAAAHALVAVLEQAQAS